MKQQFLLNNLFISLFMLRLLGNKLCLEQYQLVIYCEIPVVLSTKLIILGLLRLENVNFRVSSLYGN